MRIKMFSFGLFFLSFTPLWISILFIDIKSCIEKSSYLWTEKIGIVCIMFFFAISVLVINKDLKTDLKGNISCRLIKALEKKTITAEYLLSYILPLFAFDFTLWNEVVLFLIFFFTLAYLCLRHNYFSVNIILEVAGYRIYDCQVMNEDRIQTNFEVISRRKLNGHIGEEISLKALNNEYKLEVMIH